MTIDATTGLITWNGPEASPARQGPDPSNGLTLTPEAQAAGYKLIEFATGFPVSEGLGPLGIAFPRDGGVLVSDHSGNVRKFVDDSDGQNASAFVPAQDYGSGRAFDMTQAGDNIYMSQRDNGAVVQINDDGTLNQLIVDGLASPHGIVANPSNGHLIVSSYTSNVVYDVDPIAKTKQVLFNASLDGISISPDGSTLYGAAAPAGADHVYGFSLIAGSVGNVVFDSGFVPGDPDGAALGSGALAGTIIVNTNQGTILAINLKTKQQTVLATGGTRGDFVTVDPSDGTLLLTQTGTVARLQLPAGSTFLSDYNVEVRVEDGRGGSAQTSFVLHLTDATSGEIHGHINETPPAPAAVPGTANIWLAGMPDGTTDGSDAAPAQSPTEVTGLNLAPGNSILLEAQGSVAFAPNNPLDGPDGSSFAQHGIQFGLSSVTAPANALLAVFLGADQPDQSAAPQGLDFSSSGNVPLGTNYLSLAPKLKQVFFVGDGKTADGVSQQIIVPAGATRLFLGTMDGFGWYNNVGFFSVDIGAARTVYLDQNQDNRRDISEDSTLADIDGDYAFIGLAPDTYYVRQELSLGLQQSIPADGASQVVVLTDGEKRQNVDFTNVSRVGERANRPPTISSAPPTEVQVGEQMLYRVSATDADGDALSFDLPVHPDGMAVQPSLGVVGWVPGREDIGTRDVILRASDRFGGVVLQSFRLIVRPQNTPPVIVSTPPGPAVANLPYQYPVQAQDADGDTLTYSLVNPTGDMHIDPVSGVLSWHPSSADVGRQKIVIVATDSAGASASQTIQLNVVASAPNHAPQLYSTHRDQVRFGNAYLYAVSAADSDGDPLTYELVVAPAGMSIDPTGVVTWQPTSEQLGANSVQLKVSDGRGGEVVDQFTINVLSQAGNLPPRITSSPVTSATANVAYQYRVSASDADGDSIAFSLVDPPAGMSIDSISGIVAWRPTVDLIGQQQVTIQAVDALGSAVTQRFAVDVRGANLPPAVAGTPPTTASVGHDYTYDLHATDPEGQPLSYSLPAGSGNMQVDAQGVIHWQPTAAELGSRTVRVRVTDPQGASTNQSFVVVVNDLNPNQLPVITSTPLLKAALNQPYTYQVQAADPEGGPLHFSFLEWPNGMTIDENTGLIQWTSSLVGIGRVTVLVSDADGGDAEQSFEVVVGDNNRAPTITSTPTPVVAASQTFRYDLHASDPDADALAYTLSAAPTGMTVDAFGRIVWPTSAADAGLHHVQLTVTDGRGGVATQDFDLTVTVDTQAPKVSLSTATPIELGDDLVAVTRATDNVGVEKLDLTIDGVAVPLDSNGRAALKMTRVGTFEVLVTATDAAGNIGRKSASVTVIDTSVTDAPEVELTSPGDDANITSPTDIIGSVADPHLLSWRLDVLNFDGVVLKQIGSGVSQVAADKLGVFDPTLLQNDSYILRLTAVNTGGLSSSIDTTVNVSGNLKLGNFALSFTDLTIPVAGIPITVARTYDTLTANQDGELGYGWKLAYRDVDLRTSLPKTGDEGGGVYTPFRDGTRVYVTLPGGQREGFTFRPKAVGLFDPYQRERDVPPEFQSGNGLNAVYFVPSFVPDKGVTDKLTVPRYQLTKQGHEYFQFGGGLPYNPQDPAFGSKLTLLSKDGVSYRIDGEAGQLVSVTDRDGNSLTLTDQGIRSSLGASISFTRNAQGRITSIADLAGKTVQYAYDNVGNLVSVTDRENNKTQFVYGDPGHYLVRVIDPLGRTGARVEYDANGRISKVTGGTNSSSSISYNPSSSTTTITNARGFPTTFQYDSFGNAISETDALNHTTTRTFDDNGNVLSVTDPLGHTFRSTYDSLGNVLTDTDALNNVTTHTYVTISVPGGGEVTLPQSETDALGNTLKFQYDSQGRMISAVGPDGKVSITQTYDSNGRPVSTTDALNRTTEQRYDASGRLLEALDASGHKTSFGYSANGIPTSQSTTRTNAAGQIVSITQSASLNGNDQMTSLSGAGGQSISLTYDALGKQTSFTNSNNGRISYTTDAAGHATGLTYPDNTSDRYVRDANGNIVSSIDRQGRATEYVFDELDRLVKSTYPDGATETIEYDAAGRVVKRTDGRGNSSTFAYDANNRLTATTDALGHTDRIEHDAIGRTVSETDANGNTTRYEYDSVGNRTRTVFPNGTTRTGTFDAIGNVIRQTDEGGQSIQYVYSPAGRVTQVIDPMGAQTNYAYDELGNLLSQTDANGHVTRWEYDDAGHMVKMTLPMGESETNDYGSAGEVTGGTSFNGKNISYTYDENNRIKTVSFDAVLQRSYTYTAYGQVATVQDSR
ncbi:MAG: putative Ig domain-containing protein, partial [Aureliella sp.]